MPPAPLDTLPGVQAFDLELRRHQVLRSVQVGDGDYTAALAKPCYLAARYGPPAIAAWPARGAAPATAPAAGLSNGGA